MRVCLACLATVVLSGCFLAPRSEDTYYTLRQLDHVAEDELAFTGSLTWSTKEKVGRDDKLATLSIAIDDSLVIQEHFRPYEGERVFEGKFDGKKIEAVCFGIDDTGSLKVDVWCRMFIDDEPSVTLAFNVQLDEIPSSIRDEVKYKAPAGDSPD